MDGLISELIASQVGCWMGNVYAGASAYADDFKLLAPSVEALNIMLEICKKYAKEYDVMFNDKSQLIVFKSKDDNDQPLSTISNIHRPSHTFSKHLDQSEAITNYHHPSPTTISHQ